MTYQFYVDLNLKHALLWSKNLKVHMVNVIVFVQIISFCLHASNVITTNINTCIVRNPFITIIMFKAKQL